MQLKNHKIVDACRAMKRYGISEAKTKAALKELLKLYENNWELIIDDDYRVLLEVILDKNSKEEIIDDDYRVFLERAQPMEDETLIHESKEVKPMKQEAPSHVKTEAVELPTKRLYTRQKKKQALNLSESCSEATPSRKGHPHDDNLLSNSSSEGAEPLSRGYFMKHQEEGTSIPKSKGVKSKGVAAPSYDKVEAAELPTKTSCTIQQKKQALALSKSFLETTPSRSAPNDVGLSDSSSEEPEQPLRAFFMKNQEGASIREKRVKSRNKEAPSYEKTEDVELPTKRLCTRQQKKQALSLSKSCLETIPSRSAHPNDDMLSDSSSEELQPLSFLGHWDEGPLKGVRSENKEAPSYVKTAVVERPTKKLYRGQQEKQGCPLSKACLETTASRKTHQNDKDMFSDSEESRECQPLLRRPIRRNQEEVHSCNRQLGENIDVIMLDDSSDSDDCHTADDEDSSGLLDLEPSSVENGDCVSDLSQMDVSSSPSKGEDASLEMVEDRWIKSYMNGECFLEIGTDFFTIDERTRFRDTLELANSNAQDVLARKDNYQGNNCSAPSFPGELVFQNLIKIIPHIPKGIVSSGFECLNHLIDFTMDIEKICGESGKRLKVRQGPQASKLCDVGADQNHRCSYGVVKSGVYIDDITRGEERVKISLEYGKNVEDLPNFSYIPRNLVYEKAYVKFALARISDESCCPHCYGDCLASPIPCICAIETRGGFAYSPEGLVKEKFLEDCISVKQEPKEHDYFYCKKCPLQSFKEKKKSSVECHGHLFRKFIKECWSKCGCNKNCGNRIVQQGIKVKLQVFLTPDGKGWGLRTLEDLPRGAFVCEYVGEVVTNTELYERNMRRAGKKHMYPMVLDADWGSDGVLNDEQALGLDATVYGNVARFINHRCFDATLVDIPVEVETPDHHYYHVAFFTTRNVSAMEELTWDYCIDFEDRDHPVKAFQCLCGSPFCRGSKPLE